ncbi:MAG: PfkB family carbohydrate kinase [Candidatus Limnocylindrus sp.]
MSSVLFGTASRDRYLESGRTLPGGGVLNMAYHWAAAGKEFLLQTRIGSRDQHLFLPFLERNRIPHLPASLVAPGESSSIDIRIGADRQPEMDNYVDGVWAEVHCTGQELDALSKATHWHTVLVEGAIAELGRLSASGHLHGVNVSADFLGFRHYTPERFRDTLAHIDLAFIGWQGAQDDAQLAEVRASVLEARKIAVITLGSHGVLVADGRSGSENLYPTVAIPVAGTTIGCGDAFIAAFLMAYQAGATLAESVAAGQSAGAAATAWGLPLPDEAYGD